MIPGPLIAWTVAMVAPAARTLTVLPGSALPTLTAALAQARDGDTIRVLAGEYHEPTITVGRSVTILGQGWPVLWGGDHQVLTVTADSVTIRGLVIRDVRPSSTDDRAGIKVLNARGCRIEDNTLIDTFFGIYLSKVTGCLIRENRIRGSGTSVPFTGNAIHSWSSSDLVIEQNVTRGHRDGIYFEFTTGAEVRRNLSAGNLRYGLHFMFSHGCTYADNAFEGNGSGIAVMYSHDVTMIRNRFAASWGGAAYGLLLKDITDSRIEGNVFVGNSIGFHGEGTSRVRVIGNQFLDNGWAVQILADAEDTEFRRNRFEGNSFDVSTNSVHAASRFAENYWDRYQGYDLDRDGFGDVPFAPVRLFALVVQQNAPALILLRSFFVSLLDAAERVAPVLTPRSMQDARPLMRWDP
jgi:nitrous oxidase accessory protein